MTLAWSLKKFKWIIQVMKNIIDAFETGLYPKFKNFCEPQLGKEIFIL